MKIRNGFVSNSSSSSFIVPDMKVPEDFDYSSLKSYFNLDESTRDYEGNLRRVYSITLPITEDNRYFGWVLHRLTNSDRSVLLQTNTLIFLLWLPFYFNIMFFNTMLCIFQQLFA